MAVIGEALSGEGCEAAVLCSVGRKACDVDHPPAAHVPTRPSACPTRPLAAAPSFTWAHIAGRLESATASDAACTGTCRHWRSRKPSAVASKLSAPLSRQKGAQWCTRSGGRGTCGGQGLTAAAAADQCCPDI